jgi:amino acid transporter
MAMSVGDESPAVPASETTEVAASGLFTRNATGLVRAVSQKDNLALSFMSGTPAFGLSFGVFYVLSGFPGGSFWIAALISLPIALAFTYLFGMLTAVMPRTGGDYVMVTRILTPALGVISSFAFMVAVMLSVAYFLLGFTTLGIGPGLQVLGLVGHSHTLFRWGTNVVTNNGWKFALGIVCLLVGGGIFLLGIKWTRRIMFGWLLASMFGLAVSILVALFTSKGSFIADFNSFARPFTHQANTYAGVLAAGRKAGVQETATLSLAKTLPIVVVFAGFGIYSYIASYVGGELRQGGTMKTAHRMGFGGCLAIISTVLGSYIFFHSWGHDFLAAAYGGGFPASLGSSPVYFFLTSAQIGSLPVAVILVVCFLAVWPFAVAINMIVTTRTFFAYAFDGLFARKLAAISDRTGAPNVATLVTILLYAIVYAWAVFAANFFQVFSYAALIQFISMGLVAVAGIVLAYRRPHMFRASVSARRVFGVPLLTIIGVVAAGATVFEVWAFLHYKFFGVTNRGELLVWCGATIAAALIVYAVAKHVRRRQGVDLSLVYAEIPPE